MGSPHQNRSGEMEIFVRVVELGGFSPAARAANMTPSAVSKLIARLEARLGARLVNRSTRQLQLTPEGCAFYERATRILADLEDAERAAGAGEQPVGRVRINTSASYAHHILAPILPEFLSRHPGVTLDIVQTDAVVDLLADRTDVAVRAGPLKSSSLVAKKLGETALIVVASPSYLARCGEPRSIADLEGHNRIGFGYTRAVDGWPLRENGETIVVPATGRVQASDGEGLRHLALAGVALCVSQPSPCGRMSPPAGWFRCSLTSRLASRRRSMRFMSAREGHCRRVSGRCSTSSPNTARSVDRSCVSCRPRTVHDTDDDAGRVWSELAEMYGPTAQSGYQTIHGRWQEFGPLYERQSVEPILRPSDN